MLRPEMRILNECPTGAILRETPYIYEAIAYHSYAENGALDPSAQTPWIQEVMRVVGSEKSRLYDLEQKKRKGASDALYGASQLKGGMRG